MPAAENNGKIRPPFFDGFCDLHRFPDHRAGHKGDTKAESIFHFGEDTRLIVGRDRRVDEHDLVPSSKKRRGYRKYAQRRGRLRTREGGKEENNFL